MWVSGFFRRHGSRRGAGAGRCSRRPREERDHVAHVTRAHRRVVLLFVFHRRRVLLVGIAHVTFFTTRGCPCSALAISASALRVGDKGADALLVEPLAGRNSVRVAVQHFARVVVVTRMAAWCADATAVVDDQEVSAASEGVALPERVVVVVGRRGAVRFGTGRRVAP